MPSSSESDGDSLVASLRIAGAQLVHPLLPCILWQLIPLSTDPASDYQNPFLFAIYHAVYNAVSVCFFVYAAMVVLRCFRFEANAWFLVGLAVAIDFGCVLSILLLSRWPPLMIRLALPFVVFPVLLPSVVWVFCRILQSVPPSSWMLPQLQETSDALSSVVTSKLVDVVSVRRFRSHLFWRFFRFLSICVAIVIVYIYCQLFTAAFFEFGQNQNMQILLSFLYPWPILLAADICLLLTKQMDGMSQKLGLQDNVGSVRVIVFWSMNLFQNLYMKIMFGRVESVYTVLAVVFLNLCQELVSFPLRMSARAFRIRLAVLRWILPQAQYRHLVSRGFDHALAQFRYDCVTHFCFVANSQRLSALVFVSSLFLLRFSWNRYYYPYSPEAVSDESFYRFAVHVSYVAALEWVSSTLVWAIVKKVFCLDAVTIGIAALTRTRGTFRLSILCAIHIVQDVLIAMNSGKFAQLEP